MTVDTDEEREAHEGSLRSLDAGSHVSRPARAAIAVCAVALSIAVALLAAAASLALWFYGAWPAGVELAMLAACVLVVALTAVSVRLWVHGES